MAVYGETRSLVYLRTYAAGHILGISRYGPYEHSRIFIAVLRIVREQNLTLTASE